MKLNFGCGKKIKKGWYNVDLQVGEGIDQSFNFNKFPYPLKENQFSLILLDNVLEHLDDPLKILAELRRISKPLGKIIIKVPYYNCKGAYNDITHKHFFNETSFDNLINPEKHYGIKRGIKELEIEMIKLIPTRFGKLFPKFIRKQASYVLGEIFKEIEVRVKVIK